MSKRLLRVALPAVALALALTGCGGKQVPGGSAAGGGTAGGGDKPTSPSSSASRTSRP
jgi:hypothetical protein